MTSLRAAIKAVVGVARSMRGLASLAVAVLFAAITLPAQAATFEARRGLNMDIWVTWPDEDRWDDPDALFPFPEWRRTVNAAKLAELKAAGLDFLRMPIDSSPFLSARTEAHRDRLYEETLATAREINAAGLKVIVDLHLFAAGSNRSIGMQHVMAEPELFDAYLEIVRRLGRMVGREDPALMAFELMNEPSGECAGGGDGWPEKLQRLFAAARAAATRTTLVLSGACGGSADGLAAVDPTAIPDDNILWSFHSYAPFLLTHQGATWAGDFIPHVTGLPYPPYAVPRAELDAAVEKVREAIRRDAPWSRGSGLLSYLDEQVALVDTAGGLEAEMGKSFGTVTAWAERHGVKPSDIILGEFGMIRQEWGNDFVMQPEWRAAYVSDMAALAERHGFAWAIWGYGGAFGVVEEFEGRKAEGDVMEAVKGLGR